MPGGIVLRSAGPADAEALARVHLATWRQTYRGVLSEQFLGGLGLQPRVRFWQQALGPASRARTWLVEERDGPQGVAKLHGFASTRPGGPDAPRALELWGIYLLAERQGQGLGLRLWQSAVQDRPCFLWVAEQNLAAQAFYRRQGLLPDGGRDVAGWMEGLPVVRMLR